MRKELNTRNLSKLNTSGLSKERVLVLEYARVAKSYPHIYAAITLTKGIINSMKTNSKVPEFKQNFVYNGVTYYFKEFDRRGTALYTTDKTKSTPVVDMDKYHHICVEQDKLRELIETDFTSNAQGE